jgi:uncharacterized membrane protein YbhN (UPF0104 family)
LTLYVAATQFDWDAIGRAVSAAHGEWLIAAFAIQILSTLLKAARWKILLDLPAPLSIRAGSAPRPPSVLSLLAAIIIGQTFNILFPFRVGELTRAFLVRDRLGVQGAFALGTIGIEKLSDAVVLFVLLLGILPWLVPPAWFQTTLLSLALMTLATLIVLFALPFGKTTLRAWLDRLPERFGVARRLAPLFNSADALNNTRARVWFWALGGAAWLCAALTNYLAFRAFDLPPAFLTALFLLIALQAGIALPSLPGKIGVFNYACVLALSLFGIENEPAFAYSLGLYAVVIISTVLLGAVLLALGSRGSRRA